MNALDLRLDVLSIFAEAQTLGRTRQRVDAAILLFTRAKVLRARAKEKAKDVERTMRVIARRSWAITPAAVDVRSCEACGRAVERREGCARESVHACPAVST